MRVLLLTTHLNLGGIGIYVFSLAKALAKRAHQVFVASSGGDLVKPLESLGVTHFNVDINTKSELSLKVLLSRQKIAALIKENKIELIHAHTRVAQVLAQLIQQKIGTPYVTTCHGFFKPKLSRKLFPCWGSCCIAISEAVREHLVNDLGVKKERVTVVHNGVEIEKFSPDRFNAAEKEALRKKYGLKDGPVIGSVARLSAIKGQQFLIQAMPRLLKGFPEAQLLLVGDGPQKQGLMKQARQLGLEQNVIFAASTFETAEPLSIMDIFVFPSLMEGLGLAIIEAQAMGLPVVASNVGGIYTLVKDGINGFLVRPQDSQALAEGVLKLLQDKNTALEFGRQAKKQAVAEFSLAQMCSGIEKAYQGILEK